MDDNYILENEIIGVAKELRKNRIMGNTLLTLFSFFLSNMNISA